MSKIKDIVTGFRGFVDEVVAELKKCSWPTKPELMESTLVVIMTSILLGAFVGVSDFGLLKFLGLIIR